MSESALSSLSWVDFWNTCLNRLQELYQKTSAYETWIASIEFISLQGNEIKLGMNNELQQSWIEKHYLKDIIEVASDELGKVVTIKLVVAESGKAVPTLQLSNEVQKPVPKSPAIKPYSRLTPAQKVPAVLMPSHTFANFVEGECNSMALQVARTVANHPGANQYNPLIIHGNSGMGKTHLLQAIARHAIENQTAKNVLFRTADEFLKDFISAAKNQNFSAFNDTYECADLLVIDDMQFLIGKGKTQEQLFKLFNRALSHQRQIVLSLDENPSKLKTIDSRLLSRFESGLCCSVDAPDLDTRLEILRKKAQAQNLDLSEETLSWLAVRYETSVRELEGVLINVLGLKDLMQLEPTIENIKNLLGEKKKESRLNVNMSVIRTLVAKEFGIDNALLSSGSRLKSIALPRKVAMYLCRTLTDLSFETIGLEFQRDYSTVIAAIKSLEKDMVKDADLQKKVQQLSSMLNS